MVRQKRMSVYDPLINRAGRIENALHGDGIGGTARICRAGSPTVAAAQAGKGVAAALPAINRTVEAPITMVWLPAAMA
jgi:hypothetical protein